MTTETWADLSGAACLMSSVTGRAEEHSLCYWSFKEDNMKSQFVLRCFTYRYSLNMWIDLLQLMQHLQLCYYLRTVCSFVPLGPRAGCPICGRILVAGTREELFSNRANPLPQGILQLLKAQIYQCTHCALWWQHREILNVKIIQTFSSASDSVLISNLVLQQCFFIYVIFLSLSLSYPTDGVISCSFYLSVLHLLCFKHRREGVHIIPSVFQTQWILPLFDMANLIFFFLFLLSL